MQFLFPYFLYGLLAISIPVIIHLFNFRKFKKIYFTNVKFLQEISQTTKKKSELKHFIVLILRILTITALVFAFSQPVIKNKNQAISQKAQNVVSIYIDNSFSMESKSSKGQLLNEAIEKALEISAAYKHSDLFQLLTNDFEGRHQRLVNKDEFSELVKEVEVSPSIRKISEIITRQNDLLLQHKNSNRFSYLISDFQKETADISDIKTDSSITSFLIPLIPASGNNLFVDSCWFDSPVFQITQTINLKTTVTNHSSEDLEKIPVRLYVNGQQKALASANILAGASLEVKLPFNISQTGIHNAWVEVADYPVTFDDKFYFSFSVIPDIPVLNINGKTEGKELLKLFGKDSTIKYQVNSEKNIEYSSLSKYSLIILNGLDEISTGLSLELQKYIQSGGDVVIFPSEKSDLHSYNEFLNSIHADNLTSLDTSKTIIDKFDPKHSLFEDVFESIPKNLDLPIVFKHFKLRGRSASISESILELQNGDVFLQRTFYGKGRFYLCASPLDPVYSGFTKHAFFVVTMYNIALQSVKVQDLFYIINENPLIETGNISLAKDEVSTIIDPTSGFEMIPEALGLNNQTRILINNQLKKSGNYLLRKGATDIMGLSFNYDRKESVLMSLSFDELKEIVKNSGIKGVSVIQPKGKPLDQVVDEMKNGIRLWKIFFILALLFIAAEIATLRFL